MTAFTASRHNEKSVGSQPSTQDGMDFCFKSHLSLQHHKTMWQVGQLITGITDDGDSDSFCNGNQILRQVTAQGYSIVVFNI
jgi:hypothetical protein